jgi:hypothetical protein
MRQRTIVNRIRETLRRDIETREEGFTLVVALISLLMLSVLGAMSLLLMVSAMHGVVNSKPEERAFQIAKGGLNVAHTKIVGHEIPSGGYSVSGDLMGGEYAVEVTSLGGYDYLITSSGLYDDNGTIYRRTIQEKAAYSAERSFDALRNYLLYAGRNLYIDINDDIPNAIPITLNGNIRAEQNMVINCTPGVRLEDGLTVNGNVEAKESLSVLARPGGTGTSQIVTVNLYGDIKTGDLNDASGAGAVSLTTEGGGNSSGRINAAFGGAKIWNIYATSLATQSTGTKDILNTGNHLSQPGVDKVHPPQPDLDYYKILAMDQGNYYVGNKTVTGDLGPMGYSSVTVIYCTGDMTLENVNWNEPDLKGIFVCEGNFSSNTTSTLKFENSSIFQVVAGGDVTFSNKWQFPKGGATSEFFFWAGNDAHIELAMFAEQLLQVSAMRDVYLVSTKSPQAPGVQCTVNYRAPDVDVAAWPIDIRVTDWRELPSK